MSGGFTRSGNDRGAISSVTGLKGRLRDLFVAGLRRLLWRRPRFRLDLPGGGVPGLVALPGRAQGWEGRRRPMRALGSTHPWERYFAVSLPAVPRDVAEVAAFLAACEYVPDSAVGTGRDDWQPPDVFARTRRGDCEDHALWAWRALVEMGYRARFVLGWLGAEWHAWVHVCAGRRWYLLECTRKSSAATDAAAYRPRWAVERMAGERIQVFEHGEVGEGITPESVT